MHPRSVAFSVLVNKFTNAATPNGDSRQAHMQHDAPRGTNLRRLPHMRLMHLNGLTLIASAMLLGACAGGGDDTSAGATAGATVGAVTPGQPAQQPGAAGGAIVAQPATGQTHTVRMIVDAQGAYRYDPATLTIRRGDAVKWVMVSGAPHNVDFDETAIPSGAQAQLAANMPNNQGGLTSPMMMNPNEEYTVSFSGVPAGNYPYVCVPHLAMNMRGTLTVQ
jgi:plastocyanin